MTGDRVLIWSDRDGALMNRFPLGDGDSLDPETWARHWCEIFDLDLAPRSGVVPLGCADITVEIKLSDHGPDESSVCWASESFFIGGEA